jgi:hypothetical protein
MNKRKRIRTSRTVTVELAGHKSSKRHPQHKKPYIFLAYEPPLQTKGFFQVRYTIHGGKWVERRGMYHSTNGTTEFRYSASDGESEDNIMTVITCYDFNGEVPHSIGLYESPQTTLPNDVAIQSDGKIVAAGLTEGGGPLEVSSSSRFALLRVNSDGSVDSTFGNAGLVLTAITSSGDTANGVALQADGR